MGTPSRRVRAREACGRARRAAQDPRRLPARARRSAPLFSSMSTPHPTPPPSRIPAGIQTCASRAIRCRPPSMVAVQAGTGAMPAEEPLEGPTFHKSISAPDPIPEAGRRRAMELMETGALFRYSPGFLSETALAEADIVDYTGFKYAVGFNSCGSALFIGLKVTGV